MSKRLSDVAGFVRFAWRVQRFELTAVVAIGVLAALVAALEAGRLTEVAPPTSCLLDWITSGGQVNPDCPPVYAWYERNSSEAGKVIGLMMVLPVVIGLIPGSSLVASEIEHQTAQLAWMLAPSRRLWLVKRFLLVLFIVIVASSIAAIASEWLVSARLPWVGPWSSFNDYGYWGPVVVARTIAFTSIGVLVGAIVGRQLPAILVAAIGAIALFALLNLARPFGEPLVPVNLHDPGRSDLAIGQQFQATDGSLLTLQAALAGSPPDLSADQQTEWLDSHFARVDIGVPGERLGAVQLRECVVLIVFATAATTAAALVVERRRPY
ncbi:MAG: hypothetical protein ACRDF7_07020 [Candidatus Limnocylindrales bacterium]